MTSVAKQHLSSWLFAEQTVKIDFATDGFTRIEQHLNDSCSQLVNIHSEHGVRFCYFRSISGDTPSKILSPATVNCVLEGNEFGTVLRVDHEERQYTVWFPSTFKQFSFDPHKRIVTFDDSLVACQWQFLPCIQLSVLPSRENAVVVFPYVIMEDADGQFFEELSSLSEVESRLYRKSEWFYARKPLDLWNYLINGSIYDPRATKESNKRFRCQQCAYAWWNYFDFLHKETGKKIYTVMQDEIAYSVLLEMSEKGEWGHGFWSDEIETHARFHLDGLHLLISQYEKTREPNWLEATERGMAFICEKLMEQLDDGSLWFLHDTIEHTHNHHFHSTLFGKTPGNSLCLNTHVQALTVLHRLRITIPDKQIYAEMFKKGIKALRRVLEYQPGEALYRPLILWIMKDITSNEDNSKWNQRKRRILRKFYWFLRRRFPRLVQSAGFIERDLTLSFFSDRYHITNLKDLLTLYKQEPLDWLKPYIENGVSFVRKLDFVDALARSPYYIAWIDTLYLYDKAIERVPSEEMDAVEKKIYQQTGGYSLDYYVHYQRIG